MPKPLELDARLDIRLPHELRAEIERLAEENDRAFPIEVRRALRLHVEREAARRREGARAA